MKRLFILDIFARLFMKVAKIGANTMCYCLLYEEEMPEKLNKLRKH